MTDLFRNCFRPVVLCLGMVLFGGQLTFVVAQDSDKAKDFPNPPLLSNNLLTIEISDAVIKGDVNKMRLKITNKTADYLIFKPEEVTFLFPFGAVHPKQGILVVPPMGSATKTLGVYDDKRYYAQNFDLEINGIYQVPVNGQAYEVPPFALPFTTKSFTAGPFACHVSGKIKKETDETVVGFSCKYSPIQPAYGVVHANKVSVFIEKTNKEYATYLANKKPDLLEADEDFGLKAVFRVPGKEVDMQKVPLAIQWKGVFTDAAAKPLGRVGTINFDMAGCTIKDAKTTITPTVAAVSDRSLKEEAPKKAAEPTPVTPAKTVKAIKNPAKATSNDVDFDPKELMRDGKYYALIIAVQDYTDPKIKKLSMPIADAERLKAILLKQYTFEEPNIVFLKNPKRSDIFKAMADMKAKLTGNDNLLIYYAGHGYYDTDNKTGYWLPSDAERNNDANWFPNTDLSNKIASLKSKHVLLIADACFSGGIFSTRAAFSDASKAINEYYNKPSRRAITSGALTEVPDKSVFVEYLIKYLQNNKQKYMNSEKLYIDIKEPVINNSPVDGQEPLMGVIKQTGDEGGDFIFIKK